MPLKSVNELARTASSQQLLHYVRKTREFTISSVSVKTHVFAQKTNPPNFNELPVLAHPQFPSCFVCIATRRDSKQSRGNACKIKMNSEYCTKSHSLRKISTADVCPEIDISMGH